MNTTFTALFSIECMLKIISFGVRVSRTVRVIAHQTQSPINTRSPESRPNTVHPVPVPHSFLLCFHVSDLGESKFLQPRTFKVFVVLVRAGTAEKSTALSLFYGVLLCAYAFETLVVSVVSHSFGSAVKVRVSPCPSSTGYSLSSASPSAKR